MCIGGVGLSWNTIILMFMACVHSTILTLFRNGITENIAANSQGRDLMSMVVCADAAHAPPADSDACDSSIWAAVDSVLDERRFSKLVLNELSALLVLRIQSEKWVREGGAPSTSWSPKSRFGNPTRGGGEDSKDTQLMLLTMTVRKVLEIICRSCLKNQVVRYVGEVCMHVCDYCMSSTLELTH